MKQADLVAEVQRLVERRIDEGLPTEKAWLTHAILSKHTRVKGKDADWYRLCGYEHVGDTVRAVVRRYTPSEEPPDRQIVLPGFERLQSAYLIERDGKQMVVPIAQLTTAEASAKVVELRAMASGCDQHADELERYLAERAAA